MTFLRQKSWRKIFWRKKRAIRTGTVNPPLNLN